VDTITSKSAHGSIFEAFIQSKVAWMAATALLLAPFMYHLSVINYLLFHSIVEFAGVVIAISIFVIGWNTRHYSQNNMMGILSAGYLAVGVLSMFHTLYYSGMGVFPPRESYACTQFWIAARYTEAGAIFLAVYYLGRKMGLQYRLWLGGFLITAAVLSIVIFAGYFPDSYIEGQGLTVFKIASEYLISGVLVAAGFMLWNKRELLGSHFLRLMLVAIGFTVLAEMAFTLYVDVYGFFNFLGHYLTAISLLLIYRILVEDSLAKPFQFLFSEIDTANRELALSERRYRDLVEHTEDWVFELDEAGKFTYTNPRVASHIGFQPENVYGQSYFNLIHPEEHSQTKGVFHMAHSDPAAIIGHKNTFMHYENKPVVMEVNAVPVRDGNGMARGYRGIGRNITERELAQQILKESEGKYRSLITEMEPSLVVNKMIYDGEGKITDYQIVDVNSSFEKYAGTAKDEFLGKRGSELEPDRFDSLLEKYSEVAQTGKSAIYETTSTRREKKYFHVITYRPVEHHVAVLSTDITRYKKTEAKLRSEEREKNIILSTMAEMVVYFDTKRKVKWANQAAIDFFKLNTENIVGLSDYALPGKNSEMVLNSPLHLSMETGGFQQDVQELLSGESLLVSAYPVRNSDDAIEGYVEVSQDITGRVEMETELKKAKEESEAANEAKSRFLANVSHEIRNPLNVIKGMANLAFEASRDTEQMNYIDMIRHSANSLMGLINDILDYSKIEAHKFDMKHIPFSLSDLLSKIIFSFSSQVKEKGLDLSYALDQDIPDVLMGDPGKLTQVLLNLIGNAVKFTDQGKVELEVRGRQVDNHPDRNRSVTVHFQVKDTGIGIAESMQGKLFEVFTQDHTLDAYKYEGTGLGLAISKNLVELMGGTLEFKSQEGRGSEFFFDIPFSVAARHAKQGSDPKMIDFEEKDLDVSQNLEVLLVEDKPMNQKLIALYLERLGNQVFCASNGKEALHLTESRSFDLILMDIQLPDMDGVEITRHIRNREGSSGRHTPIIAMTAYTQREDQERYAEAGMDGYISKPVSLAELYQGIEKVLRGQDLRESRDVSDREVQDMLDRLDGDTELLQQLIAIFLEDYMQERQYLQESLDRGDWGGVASASHALKGELGNLGMQSAYEIMIDLEDAGKMQDAARVASLLTELDEKIEILKHLHNQN
jgi:PAS domain S-box-containing protein